jgi:hypothetical protein
VPAHGAAEGGGESAYSVYDPTPEQEHTQESHEYTATLNEIEDRNQHQCSKTDAALHQ